MDVFCIIEIVKYYRFLTLSDFGCTASYSTCKYSCLQLGTKLQDHKITARFLQSFIACLHDQNKSGFFGEPAFFQPIRAF